MRLSTTRTWLVAAGLCVSTSLLAQKPAPAPIVFGSVKPADFATASPTDSTLAPAEYLCDYGTSKIEGGQGQFQVIFERTTRVVIHRKAGYRYATVRVPLYTRDGKIERLTRVRGFTYNLQNGQLTKTKLNAEALFREVVDKNHIQYSFTLPDVREGSIVEFSYVINSDFIFNLQDWQFEHSIPTRWSEYRAFLPQFYIYKIVTRGYQPFAINESLSVPYATTYTSERQGLAPGMDNHITAVAQQLRWAVKDVPAFREEPFMTTPTDYLRSVNFELAGVNFDGEYRDLTGKWEGIWKGLRDDDEFERALTQQPAPLAGQAQALRQRYPDSTARAAAVLALVQRSMVYNNEARVFASQPLRRSFERHVGNSADINLLLVQTLRAAGLPATPLLLSTRDHGQIQKDVPEISQFNYVAAHLKLPGRPDVLLDATEPQLPLGLLPERCLNGEGRLADATGSWVPLKTNVRYTDFRTVRLQLSEKGELAGTVKMEYAGYAAVAARRQIRQTSKAEYLGQVTRRWQDWEPATPHLLADSLQKPVAVELALHHTPAGADATPLYLPLLNLPDAQPYDFRAESRIYPIDLGMPREHTTIVSLELPKGYTVQELPAKLALELPGGGGRYLYQVTQPTPGSVQLITRLQLARSQYSPAEYGALREMNSRILAKQNEPLVLKRTP